MLHRKPPKPIHYNNAPKGYCRFCGEIILDDKGRLRSRANWHKPCVRAYKVIYWPQETRKAVWKRDQGHCAHCPTVCDDFHVPWELDHVQPLIESNGDLEYWKLPNLQTLCVPCHVKKTSAEATARAAARAALKPPKVPKPRKR
jgi:5-methylcytosine-specific restriction endonuclease McrA